MRTGVDPACLQDSGRPQPALPGLLPQHCLPPGQYRSRLTPLHRAYIKQLSEKEIISMEKTASNFKLSNDAAKVRDIIRPWESCEMFYRNIAGQKEDTPLFKFFVFP